MEYTDEFLNSRRGSFMTATEAELRTILYLLDGFDFDEDSMEYYLHWALDGQYERVSPRYVIDDMHRNKQVR